MAKKVVVVGIGWEQEPLLQELSRQGYLIYGIHYNQDYIKSVDYEDVLISDFWDFSKILEFCESIEFSAVLTDQDDYGLFVQSVLCEKYSLPGPSVESAQVSLNKYLQREKAREQGVLIPDYALVKSTADIKEFTAKKGFPIILKPIDNRGSIGVVKIDNEAEIFEAFSLAVVNSRSHLMICEEFISGIEYTVDGFVFESPKSLAIAEKNKGVEGKQVSTQIKYPAGLKSEVYNKLLSVNESVAEKLGFDFGFLHGEYILADNGEFYLVELANRGGGCYTSEIILPAVSGMPILEYYIDFCVNNNNPKFKEPEKNDVILRFFNFDSGKVDKILGMDELNQNENVLKLRLSVAENDIIKNMTNDGDRHGFIIYKGIDNVLDESKSLMNKVKISYRDDN